MTKNNEQHVILFYQYHPLSSEEDLVEIYRQALETLCSALQLKGRILVGCNPQQSEGINGTLSSKRLANLQIFGIALQYHKPNIEKSDFERLLPPNIVSASSTQDDSYFEIVSSFWKSCQEFYEQAGCKEPLTLKESELKWSVSSDSTTDDDLFPDLNVKMVAELIGSGGILADINPNQVPADQRGYLTPAQWHERMQALQQKDSNDKDDTVLIDCRNTKEVQIGNFGSGTTAVVDPNTTTFQQFPQWVTQNTHKLQHKKVLMYCTGGIRCEKSSAYIKQVVPSVQEVSHLQGGIHKYLEEYSDSKSNAWQGKNFVFDRRGTAEAVKLSDLLNDKEESRNDQTQTDSMTVVVGQCIQCQAPYDTFHPHCVCTVCREPVLACESCQTTLQEYHCGNHQHLSKCYFTNLSKFSLPELQQQSLELEQLLEPIAVGKQYRQKRSTIRKQLEKVQQRMQELQLSNISTYHTTTTDTTEVCRSCGEPNCAGDCWGYFGLKRKQALEKKHETASKCSTVLSTATNQIHLQKTHLAKKRQRQEQLDDMITLGMCAPPSRHMIGGVRQPPACTRVLQTTTKGKWCGKSLLHVLQHEFQELASPEHLEAILESGLLRLNDDTAIRSLEQAEQTRLKNMDVIRRIVHWHEPPVLVPESIGSTKISLSQEVLDDYGISSDDSSQEDAVVYVCDKPSTVPVHPAGPYLSNALTSMVEGQLSLPPKSLIPCHRIDRATSGLTLCCTNKQVANVLQTRIAQGSVEKLYLAKVHGKFPDSADCENGRFPNQQKIDLATWSWCHADESLESSSTSLTLQVDGPIETVDAANGIRKITNKGKPATSLIQLLRYDADSDTSIMYCRPKTGRSHQLRVHLQYLGFPIVNDVLYGGTTEPGASIRIQQPSISASAELRSMNLTEQDVQAARSCCKVCQQNTMEAGFTKAQLLQEGHSICLHALRYVVNILPKKPKDGQEPLQILTAEVDPPYWAI